MTYIWVDVCRIRSHARSLILCGECFFFLVHLGGFSCLQSSHSPVTDDLDANLSEDDLKALIEYRGDQYDALFLQAETSVADLYERSTKYDACMTRCKLLSHSISD